MKTVKGNRETKSVWSALRRQITPKIGQLTNDEQSINLIVRLLISDSIRRLDIAASPNKFSTSSAQTPRYPTTSTLLLSPRWPRRFSFRPRRR